MGNNQIIDMGAYSIVQIHIVWTLQSPVLLLYIFPLYPSFHCLCNIAKYVFIQIIWNHF